MKQPLPEREQAEVAVAEGALVLPNSIFADGRADRSTPPTMPRTPSADHDQRRAGACRCGSRRACPRRRAAASFGSSAACTAWNSEERDAGDEDAGDEAADERPSRPASRGRCAPRNARVRQRLREHRAEQEQPSAPESSEYGASGPGVHEAVLAAQRERDRDRAAGARARARTARRRRRRRRRARRRRRCRTMPSEPCIMPYGAEAAVARERAARDVRDVVADERDEQRDEQQCPRRGTASSTIAPEDERDEPSDRDEREQRAERRRALDERTAADALRAAVRERAADLLLERLEEPGRDDEDERPEAVERGVVGRRELAAWRRGSGSRTR